MDENFHRYDQLVPGKEFARGNEEESLGTLDRPDDMKTYMEMLESGYKEFAKFVQLSSGSCGSKKNPKHELVLTNT
ncbi:hypothetical protein RvY_11771 [Ramazzottius varieornatus]|uniref:Uncharacterized protein n=1 Tax=Ramazzottius varieornatus TaxID=947166 RepID=A0A1D1VPY0_RAMVA|nr:hypothetical protein RvY_11771 [Ramazzottius varieornatus]